MRWVKRIRRTKDDGGGIAIIMAASLLAVFGAGAIVIDFGQIYDETRQLQNGADAAALAIAQECAAGQPGCGAPQGTADTFANANARDGASDAAVAFPSASSVTVTTSTRSASGQTFLTHYLGQLLGVPTSSFERQATASWGSPVAGGATIPLTFSQCEWDFLTGGNLNNLPTGQRTIYFHSSQTAASINTCGGPANQDHPGGFGWLNTNGTCQATIELGQVATDTGNNVPSNCSAAFFQSLIGTGPHLIPIFSQVTGGPGNNAIFNIAGFAAVEITGYRFSGSPAYNRNAPCSGNDRCISARFVQYYDLGSEPALSPVPNFGAVVINLTG